MSPDEIRQIAWEAAQEVVMDKDEVRAMMAETVRQTLLELGISHKDPLEVQADMRHLREWRTAMESIRTKGMMTLVGIACSGLAAALWLGVKEMLK